MEFLSAQFFSALLSIIVIDLVLAGDNAIVIALAARTLPEHLRMRAILWGTVGAIALRSSLTMAVVWLLEIPGLMFMGGAILIWIAYKLLLPEQEDENGVKVNLGKGFWGAIGTIVFADIIMGLDNVLGVAGAAHGSFALVIMGLLVSIPIVISGSTLILRIIERFPGFIYLGAGVLALTAAKMMTAEPMLQEFYSGHKLVTPLMFPVIISGVLWAGFVKNHKKVQSKISARLAAFSTTDVAQPHPVQSEKGEDAMLKILVPVDGSPNSLYAIRHVINLFMKNTAMEVSLLNVQSPMSRHIARFTSRTNRANFHRERGGEALLASRQMLEKFGIPFSAYIEVGDKAKVIAHEARRLHSDQIVMATARKNSLTRMLEDSTTNKVLELTSVPVEVISGSSVSWFESWGLPTALATAIALWFLSAD